MIFFSAASIHQITFWRRERRERREGEEGELEKMAVNREEQRRKGEKMDTHLQKYI